MTPGTLNLTAYRGTTFGPVVITAYSDAAHTTTKNLSGWIPLAQVRKKAGSPKIIDLVPILSNAAAGEISIPAVTDEETLAWPHGDYVWDFLLERPTGEVLGPFLAGTFTINSAVTRE